MTSTLNRQLHAVLTKAGVMKNKEALVSSFTDDRTTDSSEMKDYEARQLINSLNKQITQSKAKEVIEKREAGGVSDDWQKNDKLRKVILSNWYKVENAQTKEQKAEALKHCLSWVERMFKGRLNSFSGAELYRIKLASDKVLRDKASSVRRAVQHESTH